MSHFKPTTIVAGAAIVPLAALVIAGCGGGSNDQKGTSVPAPSPPPTAANARATVTIASTSLERPMPFDALNITTSPGRR